MYIIGQKNFISHVEQLKKNPKPFVIIKGPKHYGKEYLTKYLAKELDLTYIQMKDNKVATVRELVNNSNYNNNCLYHFVDFDNSTVAAKATLLKIAEETPKGMMIVITISANTLDTLVSRAYNINLESYSDNDIEEFKTALDKDSLIVDKLIELGVKTPSMLLYYSDIDTIQDVLGDVEFIGNKLINNRFYIEDGTKVSKGYKNPYNVSEVDKSVVFLQLLSGFILNSRHSKSYDWIFIIEDTIRKIKMIPTTNRKIMLNECMLGLVYS